MLIFHIAIPFF